MRSTMVESAVATLSSEAWQLIDAADLVVADLDGCLASDNLPLPGVVNFVDRTRERLVIASNNSTHRATELAQVLAQGGLHIAPERIALAGEVAVSAVAKRWPGARLMLLGTDALRLAAEQAGMALTDDVDADVVLLTRALTRGTAQLEAAVAALHGGAALVVANPDYSHPGRNGVPRVETGAMLALLRTVLPGIDGTIIGKPEQPLFQAALAIGGVRAERAVMIGDNAATDIAGARRLGMHTIHLRAVASRPGRRGMAQEAHG